MLLKHQPNLNYYYLFLHIKAKFLAHATSHFLTECCTLFEKNKIHSRSCMPLSIKLFEYPNIINVSKKTIVTKPLFITSEKISTEQMRCLSKQLMSLLLTACLTNSVLPVVMD